MRISELIVLLGKAKQEHGDLAVEIITDSEYATDINTFVRKDGDTGVDFVIVADESQPR